MKDYNQFSFDVSISISGESGQQIKRKIASILKDESQSNQFIPFPPYAIERSDLEINDPLYIYIDEFIKFHATFYPWITRRDNYIRTEYSKGDRDRVVNVWISNFRQREGSLEVVFELIVETVMFYGGIRQVIDYLTKDLEISLQMLSGNAVQVSVREKFTKIRIRGWSKLKIRNRHINLLLTIVLFAISFITILRLNRGEQKINSEEIKNIVKETIDKLDKNPLTLKDSIEVVKNQNKVK